MLGLEIERLVKLLSRLPGLGPRSARRAVLHLLKNKEQNLTPLLAALQQVDQNVSICKTCGNLDTANPCQICTDLKRDEKLLIVVKDVGDLWALERAKALQGRYHVLGGLLSPLDGMGPDQLNLMSLIKRIESERPSEVILALDATVEGQATAHYIMDKIEGFGIKSSRLAHGVPIGGELDYLDEGTLLTALRQRTSI